MASGLIVELDGKRPVGGHPAHLAFDGAHIWVADIFYGVEVSSSRVAGHNSVIESIVGEVWVAIDPRVSE